MDSTTDCLLDHHYHKNYYKKIAINLSKQQVPDTDSKAIKQLFFWKSRSSGSYEQKVQQSSSLLKKQN